jgi:hypothetical protein
MQTRKENPMAKAKAKAKAAPKKKAAKKTTKKAAAKSPTRYCLTKCARCSNTCCLNKGHDGAHDCGTH